MQRVFANWNKPPHREIRDAIWPTQYEVPGENSYKAIRPGRDDRSLLGGKSHPSCKGVTFSIVPTGRRRLLFVSRHFVPGYFQMSLRGDALEEAINPGSPTLSLRALEMNSRP